MSRIVGAAIAVAAYNVIAFGLPIDAVCFHSCQFHSGFR
jgi:hypothetical protein